MIKIYNAYDNYVKYLTHISEDELYNFIFSSEPNISKKETKLYFKILDRIRKLNIPTLQDSLLILFQERINNEKFYELSLTKIITLKNFNKLKVEQKILLCLIRYLITIKCNKSVEKVTKLASTFYNIDILFLDNFIKKQIIQKIYSLIIQVTSP